MPGPVVRIGIGDDLEAGLLEARHGIRRRRLDPVDLARAQGGGAGRGFRASAAAPACRAWEPAPCPSSPCSAPARRASAARSWSASTGRCPTASGRTCSSPGRPSPTAPGSTSSPSRSGRAGRHPASWCGSPPCSRRSPCRTSRWDARAALGRLLANRYCGDLSFSSLSRFHTTASALKSLPSWNFTPSRRVNTQRVLSPSSTFQQVARPGTSTRRLVGRRQVPVDQPVIDRVAHEAHAFAALVGLAGGERNVGGRHADPQGALGQRRAAAQRRQQAQRGQSGKHASREYPVDPRPWFPPEAIDDVFQRTIHGARIPLRVRASRAGVFRRQSPGCGPAEANSVPNPALRTHKLDRQYSVCHKLRAQFPALARDTSFESDCHLQW